MGTSSFSRFSFQSATRDDVFVENRERDYHKEISIIMNWIDREQRGREREKESKKCEEGPICMHDMSVIMA
jgi:hypothetical protein